jgi:mannonate dehydratase
VGTLFVFRQADGCSRRESRRARDDASQRSAGGGEEIPSKNSGITFCQGTIAEMGVDVLEEIRYFGKLGKIFLVHFRGVRGKVPQYTEVFLDEADLNMARVMKTYQEAGYDGPFVTDHTPRVEGDSPWGHRGRSFSLGYIRALVQAVNTL